MAEVDFGDSELFQQLEDSVPTVSRHIRFTDDDEEDQEESRTLQTKLEEYEDNIEKLSEENKILQRKLNVLTRPSGITVEDVNMDGPLLQILYTNNIISKQCRQEIEDCVCNVILKYHKPSSEKKSLFHMKPQNSAFTMDEDPQLLSTTSVRTTTEAFKVVGSVLYFTTFSVDKLGQPLVNENPQLTDGWDVPSYQQVFSQVIGAEGQEVDMKDKRPKSMCFNCGSSSHQLRDCPKPKDMAAINERRKEFNQNSQIMQGNQRYHAETEERFAKFKPGVMSDDLLAALGVDGNTLPPLIYRMRQLGYPPGWLKEAEMENSGLSLYDGKELNDGSETQGATSSHVSYDVSKLVDFPGFNVPAPHKLKDEFMHYGSIPMQTSHMKDNYAAYLSSNFPLPGASSNKRRQESDSSPQLRKKNKLSPDWNSDKSSDMEVESDPGMPYAHGSGDFKFQSPRPPGSPCFSSPPPLPQGTPPSTPTPPPLPKGTPPPTPTNGSPALPRRNWTVVDETVEGSEDELTLEELEEQQRLIWAALENADTATNSDSETPVLGTPALGTPAPSSPSVSTPAQINTEMEEVEEPMDTMTPAEPCYSIENQQETVVPEICNQNPRPVKVKEESPESPGPLKFQEDSPQSPEPDMSNSNAGDCASPKQVEKVASVPHRSRFAAGIVPFEDTPEFTEVAEATGTYLRIRDLLKCSPRNLAKKK